MLLIRQHRSCSEHQGGSRERKALQGLCGHVLQFAELEAVASRDSLECSSSIPWHSPGTRSGGSVEGGKDLQGKLEAVWGCRQGWNPAGSTKPPKAWRTKPPNLPELVKVTPKGWVFLLCRSDSFTITPQNTANLTLNFHLQSGTQGHTQQYFSYLAFVFPAGLMGGLSKTSPVSADLLRLWLLSCIKPKMISTIQRKSRHSKKWLNC